MAGEIKIRFNTMWEQSQGQELKWRVLVDGSEKLAKSVELRVPSWTTEDILPSGVKKWHITCKGTLLENDGHFVVVP